MYRGLLKIFLLVLFFVSSNTHGQEIKPQGQFLEDSIQIGIPVAFSLTVRYPREMDVVFPDSLYNFAPYELHRKVYFPTQSDSISSYDSAIYYLTSFEVDKVQQLKLPVYVLHGGDSTEVFTSTEEIYLQELVTELPDSVALEALPLVENTTYKNVELQFNYIYLAIGLSALVILAVVVFLIFGERISKYFALGKLKRAHKEFISRFEEKALDDRLDTPTKSEQALALWKRYMESLDQRPYIQLTTREIIARNPYAELEKSLKTLDRIMYSGQRDTNEIYSELNVLKQYSQERYNSKVEEIKNG